MNEKRSEQVAQQGYFGGRATDSVDFTKAVASTVDNAQAILAADAAHRSLAADQVLMLKMVMPSAGVVFAQLSQGAYKWFQHQGFWPDRAESVESARMKKTEKLALIMTEVAEAVEAVRKDDSANEEEEIADIFVRLFDYCGRYQIDIATAYERKMITNLSRPFKHGKKF